MHLSKITRNCLSVKFSTGYQSALPDRGSIGLKVNVRASWCKRLVGVAKGYFMVSKLSFLGIKGWDVSAKFTVWVRA